jgi:hypothetical protein
LCFPHVIIKWKAKKKDNIVGNVLKSNRKIVEIKWKKPIKYHTVGTVPKSNKKNA